MGPLSGWGYTLVSEVFNVQTQVSTLDHFKEDRMLPILGRQRPMDPSPHSTVYSVSSEAMRPIIPLLLSVGKNPMFTFMSRLWSLRVGYYLTALSQNIKWTAPEDEYLKLTSGFIYTRTQVCLHQYMHTRRHLVPLRTGFPWLHCLKLCYKDNFFVYFNLWFRSSISAS